MQPLQDCAGLNADGSAKARVARVELLGLHDLERNLCGGQRLVNRELQRIHTEPRQFVVPEILRAGVAATGRNGLGIKIGAQHPERAVDMREVGPVLVKLRLQLIDDAR